MRGESRGPFKDIRTVKNQLVFVDYTIGIRSQIHHTVYAFNESIRIVYGAHTVQVGAALHTKWSELL